MHYIFSTQYNHLNAKLWYFFSIYFIIFTKTCQFMRDLKVPDMLQEFHIYWANSLFKFKTHMEEFNWCDTRKRLYEDCIKPHVLVKFFINRDIYTYYSLTNKLKNHKIANHNYINNIGIYPNHITNTKCNFIFATLLICHSVIWKGDFLYHNIFFQFHN